MQNYLFFDLWIKLSFRHGKCQYETTDTDFYNKLADAENLDLYEPSIDPKEKTVKESFENCMVLDLAKRDIENQSFDYLMYGIVLYQLEQHNKYVLSKKHDYLEWMMHHPFKIIMLFIIL